MFKQFTNKLYSCDRPSALHLKTVHARLCFRPGYASYLPHISLWCFLPSQSTWLKQEMATRQDNKFVTKANALALSPASQNMVEIENRLLSSEHALQVFHMLSSTLSDPFRCLPLSPSLLTCNPKTNGKSGSNGSKTNNATTERPERMSLSPPGSPECVIFNSEVHEFQRVNGQTAEVCCLGMIRL